MKRMLTVVASLLMIAACGDGESRQAMDRESQTQLQAGLHTTDLSVSVDRGPPVIVTITNLGPNPADDIWLEVDRATDVPQECERKEQGFACKMGVLSARQIVTRELHVQGPTEVRVTDRAGSDSAPDNNVVKLRT